MADVAGDQPARVFQRQGHLGADAIALEGAVEAFDLAVALRIVGRGFDMGHAADTDELFEVLGDELRPVIGDDAWAFVGYFSRALWMMVSTTSSPMFAWISQWTRKRL